MHTHFSEHRLLSQRFEGGPRPGSLPEGAREAGAVEKVIGMLQQKFEQLINDLTPQQKQQLTKVGREFMEKFAGIKDDVFDQIKQDLPQLQGYFRLGGSFGNAVKDMRWDSSSHHLHVDEQHDYQIDFGDQDHVSVLEMDDDGEVTLIELYDQRYQADVPHADVADDAWYVITANGAERFEGYQARQQAEESLVAERAQVQSQTTGDLQALRRQIDKQ